MANVPPNPAAGIVAAATQRHTSIAGAQPQQPQRFSDAMRALHSRHAAERAELETKQWNERVDVTERHAAEMAELRDKEEKQAEANRKLAEVAAAAPPPPAPAPAPAGRRHR